MGLAGGLGRKALNGAKLQGVQVQVSAQPQLPVLCQPSPDLLRPVPALQQEPPLC